MIVIPDYTSQFEALQHDYETGTLRHGKEVEEFKMSLAQLKVDYTAEQIQNNLTDITGILANHTEITPDKA